MSFAATKGIRERAGISGSGGGIFSNGVSDFRPEFRFFYGRSSEILLSLCHTAAVEA
jgi:hypothetical protein